MATFAVFLALGGGAYAAIKLPKNSVGGKQIKANAVNSSKVKNRSLLAADFKAGQLPRGPQGIQGAKGDAGTNGTKGDTGSPGPLVSTLPSGATLTGAYTVGGRATGAGQLIASAGISFPFPLASAPTVTVIPKNAASTQVCPGTVANPQATTGVLCIYEAFTANTSGAVTPCPLDGGSCGTASRQGVSLEVQSDQANLGTSSQGTWAVTAP